MSTLLYSKDSISKVEYSYTTVSHYQVIVENENNLLVRDTVRNCSGGWLWHFLELNNEKNFAIYVYNPELNKDYIIILPHICINFSGLGTVKLVFDTDEQLDTFLNESGIRKMLNTAKFFNPFELSRKIKNNKD